VKKHLPDNADTLFIAGLPIGRPKANSHVNAFHPARLPINDWFKVVE
jgi:hypothetical protein